MVPDEPPMLNLLACVPEVPNGRKIQVCIVKASHLLFDFGFGL